MEPQDYSIDQVRQRIIISASVTAKEQLSALMLRLSFASPDFIGLDAISCTDTYMKLVLDNPAAENEQVMRSYSVRSHDTINGTVDIDFALHGRGGVAAQWAQDVEVGSTVIFKGVGGGYSPAPSAPWHLLVGDDSALPAIGAALERIGTSAPAVVILVGASSQQLLGENSVRLLGSTRAGSDDLAVVSDASEIAALMKRAYAQHAGTPHVFLHGEAGMVREARRVLLTELDLPKSALSASGYWRQGNTDEQWRQSKREWNAAIAREDEQAA